MKHKILFFLPFILLSGCEKDAGRGGNSTITGHVLVTEYTDATFTNIYSIHNGFDEEVFIIYGDEAGAGDNTDTGPDGRFEFKYLRTGNYKVFVISKDSVNATPFHVPDTVILKQVEITDKKQTVSAGTLEIKKILN